jgi:hypothetical protein
MPEFMASAQPVGGDLFRYPTSFAFAYASKVGTESISGAGQWFISIERAQGSWSLEIDELR